MSGRGRRGDTPEDEEYDDPPEHVDPQEIANRALRYAPSPAPPPGVPVVTQGPVPQFRHLPSVSPNYAPRGQVPPMGRSRGASFLAPPSHHGRPYPYEPNQYLAGFPPPVMAPFGLPRSQPPNIPMSAAAQTLFGRWDDPPAHQAVIQAPDVPDPPAWDPQHPSVVWHPRKRWVFLVNEQNYANDHWTPDQEYQLKVIGASYKDWEEVTELGQVFPGRRDALACKTKWRRLMHGRWWTTVEDAEFLRYLNRRSQWDEEQRTAEWDAMLQRLRAGGRTESEVDGRWGLHVRWGEDMGRDNIGAGHGGAGVYHVVPR